MQQLGLPSLVGSLKMYNGLVERCFKDCVDSFRRKDLEGSEEKVPTARRRLPHAAAQEMPGHTPAQVENHAVEQWECAI